MRNHKLGLVVIVLVSTFFLYGCQMEREASKIGAISTGAESQSLDSGEITPEIIYQVGDIISIFTTIESFKRN